jgi:very-short-patch-repair endonuclease
MPRATPHPAFGHLLPFGRGEEPWHTNPPVRRLSPEPFAGKIGRGALARASRTQAQRFQVRELPVGSFFADFACRSERLIVEVDGSQHVESEHDERRDSWLNEEGWSVLRFSNRMVLAERTAVLATILEVLEGRLTGKAEVNGWRYWPRTRNQAFSFSPLGGRRCPKGG